MWTQALQYHDSQPSIQDGTKWLMTVYAGQRDDTDPWSDKENVARFHHTTQKSAQFKTYKLFISGIFHLMFLTVVDDG